MAMKWQQHHRAGRDRPRGPRTPVRSPGSVLAATPSDTPPSSPPADKLNPVWSSRWTGRQSGKRSKKPVWLPQKNLSCSNFSTTFQVIDALKALGWQMALFTLFHGRLSINGHTADGKQIDLWYQTTPRALSDVSHYRQVLTSHGFTGTRQLRPGHHAAMMTAPGDQERLAAYRNANSAKLGSEQAARRAPWQTC